MAAARDTRKYRAVDCDSGRVEVCGLHQEVVREVFASINSRMSRRQVLWVVGTLCVIAAFYGITLWNTCSGAMEMQGRQVQQFDKELALARAESDAKILILRAELDTIKTQLDKLDRGQAEMRKELIIRLDGLWAEVRQLQKGN